MNKLSSIRVLAMLILFGGILLSPGCLSPCGRQQRLGFPDKWIEAKLPIVEGDSARCMRANLNDSRSLEDITYKNISIPDLVKKYEEKYTSEGWTVETTSPDKRPELMASKGDMKVRLVFNNFCHGNFDDKSCSIVGFEYVKLHK